MIGLEFFIAANILDTQNSYTMANPKIEQFKKILQIDPKDETLWFGLGKAYMSDQNWAEAIPALEQCIQVKPNYSAAYFALAQSLQQEKNVEKCRAICAEGITVATTNGDLLVIKNLEELNNSLPS
jgi:predicted Zn-dependent protease